MASQQGKLKQYLLILQKLQEHPNCTFTDILEVLENKGFQLSKRTFQRNIEALRYEFGIEIECNRQQNTYTISEEKTIDVKLFLQFLQTAIQTNFVVDNIKDFKNVSEYIHLSETANNKGSELLPDLLEAIKTKNTIEFVHESYTTKQITDYTVEPHLLKEYQNRWYLIAYVPKISDFRTFGIDRISDLKLINTTFKKQSEDTRHYFQNIVGINFHEYNSQPQEVIFTANEYETKYLRSKPLHHSQEEIENGKFRLFVIPNYELKQRLLMFGDAIIVLQPEALRNKIKEIITKMKESYD